MSNVSKDFLLFSYSGCALGGWDDYVDSFSTLQEAKLKFEAQHGYCEVEFAHIVHLPDMKKIIAGRRRYDPVTDGELFFWEVPYE